MFTPGSRDFDTNGVLDEVDLAVFLDVLLGVDIDPMHVVIADLNGDGAADGRDISLFLSLILGC